MSNRRIRFNVTYRRPDGSLDQVQALVYPVAHTALANHVGHRLGFPKTMIDRIEQTRGTVVKVVKTPRGGAPAPKTPRWVLDQAALDRVADFFGLKYPIHVRRTGGVRTAGTHRLMPAWRAPSGVAVSARVHPFYHHLTVSARSSAEDAARTIWHELAHAHQAERTMDTHATASGETDPAKLAAAWYALVRRENAIAYRDRPTEVEARSFEDYASEIAPARAA